MPEVLLNDQTIEEIERARQIGQYNMFQVNAVQRMAHEHGLHHLVILIDEMEKGEYAYLITNGAKPAQQLAPDEYVMPKGWDK